MESLNKREGLVDVSIGGRLNVFKQVVKNTICVCVCGGGLDYFASG